MDSNTHQSFTHQPNSGLLRFRSAPSSLLVNFTTNGDGGVNKNNSLEGSDSERLFSRFVNTNNNGSESSPSFQDLDDGGGDDDKSSVMASQQRLYYTSGLPPHYPRQSSSTTNGTSAMDTNSNGSFGLVGSLAMDNNNNSQANKAIGSNLVRQSSSPAGLFSHISVPNGIVLGSHCSVLSLLLSLILFS